MKTYQITTANGMRTWEADDADHAVEQHEDAFGDEPGEVVIAVAVHKEGGPVLGELVICGASFPHCSGAEPPEEWRETVNAVFEEGWDGNYRLLPRIEHEGTDDEEDHCEDGTWREMPHPITLGQYQVRGAFICTSCYVTLCVLSPSGAGLIHELASAVAKARSMDPAELPRIG